MKQHQIIVATGYTYIMLSCGSAVPSDGAAEQISSADKNPVQIAAGPVPQPEPDPAYTGPPHVFTPRSHPPRYRQQTWAPPNLEALPKFKNRYRKCFKVIKGAQPPAIAVGRGGGPLAKPKKARQTSTQPPQPARTTPLAEMAPAEAPFQSAGSEDAAKSESIGTGPIQETDDGPGGDTPPDYEDWGAAIYLSNDDTMSLSSAQRVIYAIDNFLPLPLAHIRPHELLNYFSFQTAPVAPGNDFSVLAEIAPDEREPGIYTLALAVRGRPIDKASRRNAAVTLVVDRSGSMADEGRMDYLKQGLTRMIDELKTGDMVHMVLFDHEVCVPTENFVVGRDDNRHLKRVIDALEPRGSTDVHRGLSRGYTIADQRYQPTYSNRVIAITDALTNTGVTNAQMISMISKYYNDRRIRLSGVGVGREFNDALLNRLTERGRGAYVFLGNRAEVDVVFGSRFISLIETTANDVHFRLHLPPSLRMNVFYGEESSTVKSDVQEIHYFAETTQLFLSDLMARGKILRPQDSAMLTIEYKDPETGEALVEEVAFNLGDISIGRFNVAKARLIMAWIDLLALMAARSMPASHRHAGTAGSWQDPEGWHQCVAGTEALHRLKTGISEDPEVRRMLDLWNKYCARYERPRHPKRRAIPSSSANPQ
ncbi:MAG: VWA domain-containing protein [Myxococcota bacterium]|nr:VWA domain-containing protein [Myxococcota bacterium]